MSTLSAEEIRDHQQKEALKEWWKYVDYQKSCGELVLLKPSAFGVNSTTNS